MYVGSVRAPSGFIVPFTERGGNKEAVISTDTEILSATELALYGDQLVPAEVEKSVK